MEIIGCHCLAVTYNEHKGIATVPCSRFLILASISWFTSPCFSHLGSLSPCHSVVTHRVPLLVPSFLVILLLLTKFPSWFPLLPYFLVILLLLTTFPSWFSLSLSFCCYSPHSPLGSLSFLVILLLLTTLPCLSSFSLPSCCSWWSRLPGPPRRTSISPQSLTPTKSRMSSCSL